MRKLMLISVACALLLAVNARADVDAGVNIDWSKTEDVRGGDLGVGARVDFGGNFRGMLAFDYFFVNAEDFFDEGDLTGRDLDLKFWELNANLMYQFPSEVVYPYIGGGLGIARRTFDDIDNVFNDDRTELGLNVLGGVKFGGAVKAFLEVRGTFYPDDDPGDNDGIDFGDRVRFGDRFVVSGGVLF